MKVFSETDLSSYHTLSISAHAKQIVAAESVDDLLSLWCEAPFKDEHKLILGQGSNVFFCADNNAVIVLNRIAGISQRQTQTHHYLHVGAGEDWPGLVEWAVDNDIAGLENLALIPGCVGSSPIQNIGAYGVELQDVCDYVDALNLQTGIVERLSSNECQFGYRDSVFKHAYKDSHIITAVGLKLPIHWQPKVEYGPLAALPVDTLTPRAIFDKVCQIRRAKLPNPAVIGNAGSFFKNPIVDKSFAKSLQLKYPSMPVYAVDEMRSKLAAGWLIDQCGLKGKQIGGARVHPEQALVLTNYCDATAEDLLALAADVVETVDRQFGVRLEHEVRFYDQQAFETRLDRVLEQSRV